MPNKIAAPTDPLAGIPLSTASPARTPRPAKVAAVPGGNVVNLAQHRKKKRLTGEAYKQARDFARGVTGYGDTSPIWGKKLPEVLTEIEARLVEAEHRIVAGDYGDAQMGVQAALEFNRELQKRVATGQLIGAQS